MLTAVIRVSGDQVVDIRIPGYQVLDFVTDNLIP
jgi:hypothetical protein